MSLDVVCSACGQRISDDSAFCPTCAWPVPGRAGTAPRPAAPSTGISRSTVLLILCGGGIVVLLIGAAIAIGTMSSLGARRKRNEESAAIQLRRLATAQATFHAEDRDGNGVKDFWTADVAGLYDLAPNGNRIELIDRRLAQADGAPRGASGLRVAQAGYLFYAVKRDARGEPYDDGDGRHPSAFAYCASPRTYSVLQRRTFILSQEGVLWQKDTKGEPIEQWPSDPQQEGWTRLP